MNVKCKRENSISGMRSPNPHGGETKSNSCYGNSNNLSSGLSWLNVSLSYPSMNYKLGLAHKHNVKKQ